MPPFFVLTARTGKSKPADAGAKTPDDRDGRSLLAHIRLKMSGVAMSYVIALRDQSG
jgi:hypothetical protein